MATIVSSTSAHLKIKKASSSSFEKDDAGTLLRQYFAYLARRCALCFGWRHVARNGSWRQAF